MLSPGVVQSQYDIAKLMAEHEQLVYWVARRVMGPWASEHDLEDCASEIRLQMLRAAKSYNPGRGIRFVTYSMRLLRLYGRRWRSRHLMRGIKVPDYILLKRVRDFPQTKTVGDDLLNLAPCKGGADGERDENLWVLVRRQVTQREYEVLHARFVESETLRAIALRLRVTTSAVGQIVARAINKLRRLNLKEEDWLC